MRVGYFNLLAVISVLRSVFFPALSYFPSWEIGRYSKVVYPISFCKTSLATTGRPVSSSPRCLPNKERIWQVNLCCIFVIAWGGRQHNHVIKQIAQPADLSCFLFGNQGLCESKAVAQSRNSL